jgi:NitT/TauT family transport system permease protein
MKKFFKKEKLNILFSLLSIAFIIIVWIISYYSVGNDYIVPSFGDTMGEMGRLFISSSFWVAFLNTFARMLLAFVISFILAVVFSSICAIYKPFKAFMNPIITLLRTAPTMAVIIILLIWSNAIITPIVITVLVLFPMLYANCTAAIDGVDNDLIEMAKVYKLSKKSRLFAIYLPQIAPNVLSQAGTNLSFGLKLMVSAEVLSSTVKSLGGLMQTANLYIRIPEFFALVLIAVIFGFLLECIVNAIVTFACKWRVKGGRV